MSLGDQVRELQQETKFMKLRELIESADFRNEQLLIFTEHRDTLEYLRQRFEALGYTGQLAYIHGGMDVEEREKQRIFFMPAAIRREQGIKNPDAPTARFMLATDAAGEGINLQFAWIMVNFDIPWNPARLEQRMGRLHRFGQQHAEVRIFNMVAEGTREGDVLATLLFKLDEARKDLCSDKVFDVIGQQLEEVSLRDLMREALFETAPYSAQRKLDTLFATQRLRAAVEEQRQTASTYGDVAKRLGQLNGEIEVERFNRLLPAYIQNFVDKAAPRLGIQIEGDVTESARFAPSGEEGSWLRNLRSAFPNGLPDFLTVRRDSVTPGIDSSRICFLTPRRHRLRRSVRRSTTQVPWRRGARRGLLRSRGGTPVLLWRLSLPARGAGLRRWTDREDKWIRPPHDRNSMGRVRAFSGRARRITCSLSSRRRNRCSGRPGICW